MSDERIPRLLVVDDEPLIIRAIGRALRGKVEVVGAVDGETALKHVVKGDVDVIMAESSVLDKQGRSFVHRLEADYPQWLDRLILASGGRNLTAGFFLQDKHGCPFLYKPIDPEILIAVIERIHKA